MQICESLEVKFPRATRPLCQLTYVFSDDSNFVPDNYGSGSDKKSGPGGVSICYIVSSFQTSKTQGLYIKVSLFLISFVVLRLGQPGNGCLLRGKGEQTPKPSWVRLVSRPVV